jgi:chromosome segregation ATPase
VPPLSGAAGSLFWHCPVSEAAAILSVMGQPPDLETRVSTLETQVRDLTQRVQRSEQDAAAARVLAGGADRDVTEMGTEIREFREQNTRVLNAMREDLTDLRAHVDERFSQVDAGFAEMRGKFDAAAAGQEQIVGLLTTLIAQRGDGDEDGGQ